MLPRYRGRFRRAPAFGGGASRPSRDPGRRDRRSPAAPSAAVASPEAARSRRAPPRARPTGTSWRTMWSAAPPLSVSYWTSRATETLVGGEALSHLGEHARPVVDLDVNVVRRDHVARRQPLQLAPAGVVLQEPGALRADHADHVRDDRGSRLEPAGTRPLERDLPDRVALEHHGVERPLDAGKRMVPVDERRPDAHVERPSTSVAAPTRRSAMSSSRAAACAPARAPRCPSTRPRRGRRATRRRLSRGSPSSPPRRRPRRRRSDRPPHSRAAAPRRAPPRRIAPLSIRVRMKFVVPLTMPSTRCTFVTTSDSRSTLITGIAAQTLASKRSWTLASEAAANSSPPRRATSCLFAETTGRPARNRSRT